MLPSNRFDPSAPLSCDPFKPVVRGGEAESGLSAVMMTSEEVFGWLCFFDGNELKQAEAAGPRANFKLFFEEEKGKASGSFGWFCFFGGSKLKQAEAAGLRADFRSFFEEEEGKGVVVVEEEEICGVFVEGWGAFANDCA